MNLKEHRKKKPLRFDAEKILKKRCDWEKSYIEYIKQTVKDVAAGKKKLY